MRTAAWTEDRALLSALDAAVTYAYQPVVNIHTGEAFGFEALMRGVERLAFASIADLLGAAFVAGIAVETEMLLQEKAIAGFMRFAADASSRLFFNLHNRVLSIPSFDPDASRVTLERHRLTPGRFCLEISEAEGIDIARARTVLRARPGGPLVAIDDFGTGHSGLRLLAESKPDIIKIDRFFVENVDRDREKRHFLEQMVKLVRSIGVAVVAEGIENAEEFRVCREIGCDYAQGYFIARPTDDLSALEMHYPNVAEINRRNRRHQHDTANEIRAQLDSVAPLRIDSPMIDLLDAFSAEKDRSFFPVVNERGEPAGIVHEERLKQMIYSPFGRALLTNRVRPHYVRDFISTTLSFDVHTGIDRILSAIAQQPNDHAVLITEGDRYIGLLDTRAIIRTMHDRMLTMARDQNPLTKLPGNTMVADYMVGALEGKSKPVAFAYLDFDNFKPFNDRFGFRQGDRAITMFADLMRSRFGVPEFFLGHVGGDDFFLGAHGPSAIRLLELLPSFIAQFSSDMESFYDEATRRAGVVEIVDRQGATQIVPLLSVSCGCLHVGEHAPLLTMDAVAAKLANLKKRGKVAAGKIATDTIGFVAD